MILRRLLPPETAESPGSTVDLEDPRAVLALEGFYAPPRARWLRINLVAGIDGGARGADGISDGLSNPADRRVLGVIRRWADVVLVGASTVRAEGFRIPRAARLAVVSTTGDFGNAVVDPASAARVTVYCPAGSAESVTKALRDARVAVVEVAAVDGRIDPAALIGALHERGADSIVCEGGPSLVGQLLDAELVDEVCLTTGPLLAGSTTPVFAGGGVGARVELTQLLADDLGALYARWRVIRREQSATTR